MPPDWIRPARCETAACAEYRTVGDKVFVRNGQTENLHDDGNILVFTVAEWDTFVAGLVAGAPCTCSPAPHYDGPAVDCTIHGAVRALNESIVERNQLRENLISETARAESLAADLAEANKQARAHIAMIDALQRDRDRWKTDCRKAIAEAAVLRHRDRRTQAVVEAAKAWLAHRRSAAAFTRQPRAELIRLADAVDAYEKGPTEPPTSPLPAEQPPVVPVEGLEAQGGACPAAARTSRVWNAGDPEPEGVEKVRDCDGDRWTRSSDGSGAWKCDAVNAISGPIDWDFVLTWAPLTEVLPEPAPVADNDHDSDHVLTVTLGDGSAARFVPRPALKPDGEVPEAGRAGEAQCPNCGSGSRTWRGPTGTSNPAVNVPCVHRWHELRAASPLIERAALLAAANRMEGRGYTSASAVAWLRLWADGKTV